jgi:hypothetical protein
MTARLLTYADAGLHLSMRDCRDCAVAIPREAAFLRVATGRNWPGGPRYSAALRSGFDAVPCGGDDVIWVKERRCSRVSGRSCPWCAYCAPWPTSAMLGLASRY